MNVFKSSNWKLNLLINGWMNDKIKVTSSFEILCNCINAENTKLKFSVLIRFKVLDWSHIRKHIGL